MGQFLKSIVSTKQLQTTTQIMKTTLFLWATVFVVVAFLAGSEAGCNEKGCCYCHSTEGYVIDQGEYKTACLSTRNTGGPRGRGRQYRCVCNHDEWGFYGECSSRRYGNIRSGRYR